VSALQFTNVTIELAGRTVLAGIDLAVEDWEFVGVLGANGSGKTTLLRAALGLVPATRGTISVLGRPVRAGNPVIGYMPQQRSNIAALRLTGWDLVAGVVNGHRLGLPIIGRDDHREVEWALDLVGARELARRPLTEISGGERQRLLLAQALIGRPRLLLLDEPLISLDPSHQQAVIELTKAVQSELGIAVLFSSHELNPLLGVLDRVLYLGHGKAALGPVDEVITGPVLSRLYGAPIEVVRVSGRIFVMSGAHDVERDDHSHDHSHEHDRHSHAAL
jgi:zinc/manganese transport system ATP-binding protein